MKTRKIQVTGKKMDELTVFFRTPVVEPVGDHLSDDECLDYAAEILTSAETNRMDEHLASCPDCTARMEECVTAAQAWQGEDGKQRLAGVRQRGLDAPTWWERLSALLPDLVLWPNVALGGAQAATQQVEDGQTEDGSLRWRIVEDATGNLTIRFGSHRLELDRVRLRLQVGNLQRDMVLSRVASDQVGAETVITRDERAQLPANAALGIELIQE